MLDDIGRLAGRVPPHDLDAEGAVLSAVLLGSEAFDAVQELLQVEHFYSEANGRIYEAVVALQQEQRPVDLVSVAGWLRDRERLAQVGGTPYLIQVTEATPAVANVEAHARTIREKWRVRELIKTCQRFAAEGFGDTGDVQQFIDRAEQSVFDIARTPEGSTVVPIRTALTEAFKKMNAATAGGISGISTGFSQLDRTIAGLHEGDLYIVAGRPGMGKTSFVLNLAVNVASPRRMEVDDGSSFGSVIEEPGYGVAFFSLEMPREQLAARLLASEGRVNVGAIRRGETQKDWDKLTSAAARLQNLPLWLDDTPAISLLDLRGKIRRLKAEIERGGEGLRAKKLGLVIIDYLQLMSGRQDAKSREQEISELSRGLKHLAKELKVSVMALSQLNRSVETRTTKDKRPQLSDLRESGAIEQDADTILFIYRDEYYFRDSMDKGIAEVIVAKQRNGPTGIVRTKFTADYTRFDNLELGDHPDVHPDDFEQGL